MKIFTAIHNSDSSRGVLQTAGALARLLGVDVKTVTIPEDDSASATRVAEASGLPLRVLIGAPAAAIIEALGQDEVIMAVVGAGTARTGGHPVGHVTREVTTRASKPVVVVPPSLMLPKPDVPVKVVVPLDGNAAPPDALREMLGRLGRRGADVVALHVVNAANAANAANAPTYWDHFYYDYPAWHKEFLRRNCLSRDTRLEVGRDSVVTEILNLAAAEQATLIAVAWSQDLSPGRAAIVSGILSSSRIPVLLVPVAKPLPLPADLIPAPASGCRLAPTRGPRAPDGLLAGRRRRRPPTGSPVRERSLPGAQDGDVRVLATGPRPSRHSGT